MTPKKNRKHFQKSSPGPDTHHAAAAQAGYVTEDQTGTSKDVIIECVAQRILAAKQKSCPTNSFSL